ncbi:hypothetical protein [Clostridium beijerinckii]|uniref:hypothetical protein n=1 Tax=Clostridium beijerinckii TaxID=1520 RepID=UPI000809AD75|nr:hypothetical protein [Clostridium beijerinckii]OCA99405.1 hypothetical protein BGS1_09185 [Clostridium beijerinckii]
MNINKKELTFQYFRDNPDVVWQRESIQHYKKLGIRKSTYITYKREYIAILRVKESSMLKVRNAELYFKGRPRQKFIFNDSRLFRK